MVSARRKQRDYNKCPAHAWQPNHGGNGPTRNNRGEPAVALKVIGRVHTGQAYHQFMLASRRDQRVRDRFLNTALQRLPAGARVLDLGAGTGIDARVYAAHGHPTLVHEPAASMRSFLRRHCRTEIESGTIRVVSPPLTDSVHAVTADFAVFNHIEDLPSLFHDLAAVVEARGFVLASLLSPYFLGDARYGWWRANLVKLLRDGHYASPSESRIHRFAPRVVVRAAAPHFLLERLWPRWPGLATRLYMFLLLRRT